MIDYPPFSLLIAVYHKDDPTFFRDALISVSQQTLAPNEVVIVQDGPIGDSLLQVLQSFESVLPIVHIALESNMGLAMALNIGLKKCKFDLVARFDSDDFCYPDRFFYQLNYMRDNPDVAVSSGFIEEWDVNFSSCIHKRVLPLFHDELVQFSKFRSPISHPAAIFRKSIILACGGYPLSFPEDHRLWIKIILSGYRIGNVDAMLLKMRCGDDMLKRRGLNLLKGEIRLSYDLYKSNFITLPEFLYSVLVRFIVRLSPLALKRILYRLR